MNGILSDEEFEHYVNNRTYHNQKIIDRFIATVESLKVDILCKREISHASLVVIEALQKENEKLEDILSSFGLDAKKEVPNGRMM